MADKLGILAGSGELPLRIIEACRGGGKPFFVLAFDGACDPAAIAGVPHAFIRLGAGGKGLKLLRANGVDTLVMAGGVRRPSYAALRPDWRALRFLMKIGVRALADFGDDALFRAIIKEFEAEGFRVIGADQLLAELLAPLGPLGRITPATADEADIALGLDAARAHGARDLGQAVIVRDGAVLGVEDEAGTDALIRRCGAAGAAQGGILVKTAKPGQERRADLPAIGPSTVVEATRAGLRGVAIEAGGALVLDRQAVIDAADRAGIFLVGVKPR